MLKRVLLLFTALVFISQPSLMAQPELLTGAKELIQQEKFDEAEAELRGLLNGTQRIKNADEVYYWLGVIKYRQDAFEQAKSLFEESLATKSKSPYGHAGTGLMRMIEQNYTEANSHLQDAEAYSKMKIPEVIFAMAEAYLKGTAPEIAKAKQLLYAYRTQDPEDPRTYIMLGEYYKIQGVPELAIEELEKAIEKDPTYVPAYTGLGELYYERGKETKSSEDYQKGASMVQKAIELNPEFAPAYRIRAELFLISSLDDRYDRARKDIERYLELAGNDLKAKVRYIQFLFLTGDHQLVLDEMDAIDTTTNVLRRLKGMSLAELGQYGEAKSAMEDYFSNTKEQYYIALDYEVYGDIFRKQGMLEEADVHYQKAMSMKPAEYSGFYEGLADEYKAAARAIEAQASAMKKEAKGLRGKAMDAYNMANTFAGEGNEAGRDSMKAIMDGFVAERQEMLDKADEIAAGAVGQFELEAYYRSLAITFADPVALSHYKDHGIALYKAKKWNEADEAFKKVSELKADYMLPYTYRFRIAYELEKDDPDVNNWLAKPVSDDVIAAFSGNPTGNGLSNSDMSSLLLSYEVQALYAFDPEGLNENYNCEGARPWIDKIVEINPDYARIGPVKEYCDEVQGR